MSWPGGVVQLTAGAQLVPAWKYTTGHELFVRGAAGGAWSAIDAIPGSASSDPKFLTAAGGLAFYAAFDSSELWVTDGVRARALSTAAGTITGVTGIAVQGSQLVVTAGDSLLVLTPPADAAAEGAVAAGVAETSSGAGITDVSALRFGPDASGAFFYGTKAGVRSLFRKTSAASDPEALYAGVAASGAPTTVSAGIAFVTASGAVKVLRVADGSISSVAPALTYAGAAHLAWVWSGLCFTAITTPGSPAEIVCAGVDSGDFGAGVVRSAAAGMSLPSPGYLLGVAHNVLAACDIAGAGGPHLCAFDGVTGALAWSTKDHSAGLSVNYNAQTLIGDTLYFAAEAAGSGKATLWQMAMAPPSSPDVLVMPEGPTGRLSSRLDGRSFGWAGTCGGIDLPASRAQVAVVISVPANTPAGSRLSVNTCEGSNFDTMLFISELPNGGLPSPGQFTCLASNDDSCGLRSAVNVNSVTPGASYAVIVTIYGNSIPSNADFTLSYTISGSA